MEFAGVEAQLQGGTIDGLSTAIGLQITVEEGRIRQSNFDSYRLCACRTPDVEAYLVDSTRNLRALAKWAFRARLRLLTFWIVPFGSTAGQLSNKGTRQAAAKKFCFCHP